MFWVKNKSFEGAAPNGPETLLKIAQDRRQSSTLNNLQVHVGRHLLLVDTVLHHLQ